MAEFSPACAVTCAKARQLAIWEKRSLEESLVPTFESAVPAVDFGVDQAAFPL